MKHRKWETQWWVVEYPLTEWQQNNKDGCGGKNRGCEGQ